MSGAFQAPKGIAEYVPPRSEAWLAVRDAVVRAARRAGYGYVELPLFEHTDLFVRGVGESTDVVTKEMYTFTDRGGRSMTLRPEATAGLLRAVLEHGLDKGPLPVKLWCAGPMFRAEQPQAGRYRQFSQVDVEAIGTDDPAVDAELVVVVADAYRELVGTDYVLHLNSLGCRECRPAYRETLQAFLRGLDLDAETRRRVEVNPLRVLDDKRPEVREQLDGVPLMADHLFAACKEHHDSVRAILAELGIGWLDDARLVRGLDYYTRTVFEFVHDRLGAQATICAGGRYDGLSESIGGPPLPGIGFALGIDRTLLACEVEGVAPVPRPRCDVFAVPLGEAARHRLPVLVARLRRAGIATDHVFGTKGLKNSMKAADRSGARYAVVLGDRDLTAGVGQVKDLASGEQTAVPLDDVTSWLEERLR
jgi:histidyl-tRNA synthetase